MAVTVNLNGVDYRIPSPGESDDWGTALNAYLIALASAGSFAGEWHNVGTEGEPDFQNGWGNADGLAATAFCTAGPLVLLKGDVYDSDGVIFTLPVAYRPSEPRYFVVAKSQEGISVDVVSIAVNGQVALIGDGTGFIVYLGNISFRTTS